MPTPTYDLIASSVLSSAAANVTFSGISGSYRDLIIVADAKFTLNEYLVFRLNGVTTTGNYPYVRIAGDGNAASSDTNAASFSYFYVNGSQSTTRTTATIQIMDYSATNKHKPILCRSNTGDLFEVDAWAYRFPTTNAITQIQFLEDGGANLQAGSSFYIYGIAA